MHVVIQFDYHSPDHACPITCYFSVPHKNEEVCELDHTDILNFTLQEHTKYFTETYYNTREYAPRRCCGPGCERNFLPEDYSVGIKNPVWTCRNAANAETPRELPPACLGLVHSTATGAGAVWPPGHSPWL